MNMYIDIVGACNLSCPSCPMGNSENLNFKKAMQIEMFREIVEKPNAKAFGRFFSTNGLSLWCIRRSASSSRSSMRPA